MLTPPAAAPNPSVPASHPTPRTPAHSPARPTAVFALLYRPGPAWLAGRPVRVQPLAPHRAYAQTLFEQGRLLCAGPFLDDSGGIALVRAATYEDAHDVLAGDPAVVRGVLVGEVRPWLALFDWTRALEARLAAHEDAERNAEAVRDLFRAVETRAPDALWRGYDGSVTIHEEPSLPYGGEYHGPDGVQRHTLGYLDTWDALQGDAERRLDPEVIAAGDRVAVLYHHRARNAATGEALDSPVVGLYRLANGRVVDARMFHFDAPAVVAFWRRTQSDPGLTVGDAQQDGSAVAGERELNTLLAGGDFRGAFERWYADDVVMQEAGGPETVGKVACRAREAKFAAAAVRLSARLVGAATAERTGYSEWEYAVDFGEGRAHTFRQVAVREWRDGRVVRETYYHPDFPRWMLGGDAGGGA